jgi:hypothetical protein
VTLVIYFHILKYFHTFEIFLTFQNYSSILGDLKFYSYSEQFIFQKSLNSENPPKFQNSVIRNKYALKHVKISELFMSIRLKYVCA